MYIQNLFWSTNRYYWDKKSRTSFTW